MDHDSGVPAVVFLSVPSMPIVDLMSSEGHVRMTDREITLACEQLGVPRPSTLPGVSPADSATADSETGRDWSRPWLPVLLTTLGQPETVVFAHCQETGNPVSIAVFALSPPWAVEQLPEPGSAYGLTLFSADEVLQRVRVYCRLSVRSLVHAGSCEISGRTWLDVLERAATDLPSALRLLRADGVGSADRDALGAALAGWERMAQVTVVQRPTSTRLEGSTTCWLDGGAAGLWEIDAPKLASSGDYGDYGDALLERARMTLRPVSDESLLESIRRGFPSVAA
jgi:hypothetical protein